MRIYLADGEHRDTEINKELVFVLPKPVAICRNDQAQFGARMDQEMMFAPDGQSTYFNMQSIRFLFPEKGRMEVFFDGLNISNDLYYLNFIFNQVKFPVSHASIFAGEPFSDAGVPSLTSMHIDYKCASVKEYEFKLLVEFCERNGIEIDRKYINKITYVLFAINPALRELWKPGVSLDNFLDAEGWNMGDRFSESGSKLPECLSKNNFKECIEECFGFSNKKLIKIVAAMIYKIRTISVDPLVISKAMDRYAAYDVSKEDPHTLIKQSINKEILMIGYLIKGLITVDHIYKILEDNEESFITDFEWGFDIDKGRALLEMFPVETRMKLLKNLSEFSAYSKDTYDQYNEFKDWTNFNDKAKEKGLEPIKLPSRWKNIKELHDNISRQYRDIKAAVSNSDIKYSPETWELLNEVRVEDMVIRLPIETAELSRWGKIMKNCIAGRGDDAAKGSSIILGVYKKNSLIYNIEISKTTMVVVEEPTDTPLAMIGTEQKYAKTIKSDRYVLGQFRGIGNKNPDPKDKELIEEYMKSTDLLQEPLEIKKPVIDPAIAIEIARERQALAQELPNIDRERQRTMRRLIRDAENN